MTHSLPVESEPKSVQIWTHLARFRVAINMTQDELGKYAGASRHAISRFERGVQTPAPEIATQIHNIICTGLHLPYHTDLWEVLPHIAEDQFLSRPSAPREPQAANLRDENKSANLRFSDLRKLIELQEDAQEVADLLKAIDLIGDGIGGDKGFAVSAVALQAKAIADNLVHSIEVLARPREPAPDTAPEEA